MAKVKAEDFKKYVSYLSRLTIFKNVISSENINLSFGGGHLRMETSSGTLYGMMRLPAEGEGDCCVRRDSFQNFVAGISDAVKEIDLQIGSKGITVRAGRAKFQSGASEGRFRKRRPRSAEYEKVNAMVDSIEAAANFASELNYEPEKNSVVIANGNVYAMSGEVVVFKESRSGGRGNVIIPTGLTKLMTQLGKVTLLQSQKEKSVMMKFHGGWFLQSHFAEASKKFPVRTIDLLEAQRDKKPFCSVPAKELERKVNPYRAFLMGSIVEKERLSKLTFKKGTQDVIWKGTMYGSNLEIKMKSESVLKHDEEWTLDGEYLLRLIEAGYEKGSMLEMRKLMDVGPYNFTLGNRNLFLAKPIL